MTFIDLGLSEELCRAVSDVGYTTPTPIQAQAIPLVLMNRDLLASAQTGTGKTAAFTLPIIDILSGNRARARMPRSIILEPTRELANQVAENFDLYGKYTKLTKALIIGGENMDEQIKLLDRGVDVLIATPGRLIDLFERGRILLNDIKILVIDEADRMLDMGFIPDIERICKMLSPMRQTLMFSATLAPEIKRLSEQFMMNPKTVSVSPPASTSVNVEQFLVEVGEREKREVLRHLLRTRAVKNAYIFCNRKKDIGILQRSLERHGFNAAALHGDMVQSARTATFEAFKADKINLLVCSDVAARGLDVSDVSHVFNFDVPIHAEDYVHRIGRTGRAGKTGEAYTFATRYEQKYVDAIEKLTKKPIPRFMPEGFVPQQAQASSPAESGDDQQAPAQGSPVTERAERSARGERRPRAARPEHRAAPRSAEPRQEMARPAAPPSSAPRPERRYDQRHPQAGTFTTSGRYIDDPLPDTNSFGDDIPAFLKPRKIG